MNPATARAKPPNSMATAERSWMFSFVAFCIMFNVECLMFNWWVMSFDGGCYLTIFALRFVETHSHLGTCVVSPLLYGYVVSRPLPCKCCGIKTIALFLCRCVSAAFLVGV